MSITTIRAIYKDSIFKPLETPTGLTENQVIELEIRPLPPVTSNPLIMGGKPCITGTRMPIDWVMGYLEAGRSLDQFLSEYPQYAREQVTAAIQYAIEKMGYPEFKHEAKIIAHATHCTRLTAHGAEEIPYSQH